MRFLLYFLVSFGLHHCSVAQAQYQVTNEQGEALAFVNILIDGETTRGIISDIDGHFIAPSEADWNFLEFRYLGYENKQVKRNQLSLDQAVILTASAFQLEEAVVIAGENPAHSIIRKAIENRERHDPEKLKSYRCQIYNKLKADFFQPKIFPGIDRSKGKIGQRIDSIIENRSKVLMSINKDKHVFLMESLVERSFLAPRHLLERILKNRISGFQSPSFSALIHSLQPFSFYEDYLSVLDQSFLNPISKNSIDQYYFELKDTLIQGRDSIFEIAFHPRSGKVFEGLKGVLQIHTDGYALYSIRAQPATPGALHLTLQQLYQKSNDQWFPHQLNIEIEASKYPLPYLGIQFSGRSYIDQVEIDPELRKKDFPLDGIELVKGANSRSDSIWQDIRIEPLNKREALTYTFLDSLGNKKGIDRGLRVLDALFQGKYPIGPIDWDLTKVIRSNDFEGFRPGIRLVTNDKFMERFRIGAYAGYGFKDKNWKVAGDIEWDVIPRRDAKLKIYHSKDVLEPARFELDQPGEILTTRVYASRMDLLEKSGFSFGGFFLPYTFSQVQLEQQVFKPQYEYSFLGDEDIPFTEFSILEWSAKVRYAFGEKFTEVFGARVREKSSFPSILIEYRQGIFREAATEHKQLLTTIEGQFRLGKIGLTSFSLMGGHLWGTAPLSKLYSTTGLGNEFGLLIDEPGFRTMRPYEFLGDRFAFLFVKHEIGSLLGKKKFFRPSFNLEQGLGIGSFKDSSAQQGISFKTLEQGYLESGIVIDNILALDYFSLGYIGLGVGAFYRYGANWLPEPVDNWAFKMTLNFDFL